VTDEIEELDPSERFAAMLSDVQAQAGELGEWNRLVDWEHGTREMASLYEPLTSQNRLYINWIYGRLSSLVNAVMLAVVPARRDTSQESAIEMLFGQTLADLQVLGYLVNKGCYAQAYSAARMTYECCDLADLFWIDPQAGDEWFTTVAAHRDFSRRRVRERLVALGASLADDAEVYGALCFSHSNANAYAGSDARAVNQRSPRR
jgi:hypothetical protein